MSKSTIEFQASSSSKKRNKKKNLPEDEKFWDEHKPVLNVKSKKRVNSKKRPNSKKRIAPRKKLRNKMTLEPEANLPEEDQLSDAHDHKTVYRFFELTFDAPLYREPSPMMEDNFSEEYEEIWNERVVPEGYELSDNHDHDKCIAEQLGLDINRPIPPYYAKYFYNQATPSPEGSFILSASELATFTLSPPRREASPLPELFLGYKSKSRPRPRPIRCDGDLGSSCDGDLGSSCASLDVEGPMTRSETKKAEEAEEAFYRERVELDSHPDEETSKWLKRLDDYKKERAQLNLDLLKKLA